MDTSAVVDDPRTVATGQPWRKRFVSPLLRTLFVAKDVWHAPQNFLIWRKTTKRQGASSILLSTHVRRFCNNVLLMIVYRTCAWRLQITLTVSSRRILLHSLLFHLRKAFTTCSAFCEGTCEVHDNTSSWRYHLFWDTFWRWILTFSSSSSWRISCLKKYENTKKMRF